MRRRCLRTCAAAMVLLILCVCCNLLAFTIDTPRMRVNAAQGVAMIGEIGSSPELVGGFMSAKLDNYTVVLKLKTAAYVGPENLLQKAFGGLRVDPNGETDGDTWRAYATYDDSGTIGGLNYARYWHGYTLPLRLLLCVLNLSNIQMLLYFGQLVLFVAALMQMKDSGLGALIPAFIGAYFLLMPASLSLCIQYAPCSLLMLAACVIFLRWRDFLSSTIGLSGAFLLLGMLTNYFDLLTFPLITLGFPLVLLTAQDIRNVSLSPTRLIIDLILRSVCWGVGFAGMWVAKWCLAALVFGPIIFTKVFEQTTLRLSGAESGAAESHRFASLLSAVNIIADKTSYRLIVLLSAAASLISGLRQVGKTRLNPRACALLMIACFAPAMGLVMANHWADHGYFAYRNLAVSFFAAYAFLTTGIKKQ